MANTNPKHTFDFEGILSMDVNQKNWKEVKKQLEAAFGNFKIAFAEGMAEEEAKKYISLFNKMFAKIKLPDIGLDDLRNNFDKIAVSVENALATINNIDTSAFKGMETSLEHISDQMDKIVEKIGKGTQKATKAAIASVAQLDRALAKVGDSTKEIESSLNFSLGDVKKPGAVLKKMADEWREFEAVRVKSAREGAEEDIQNWVKRQQAMTKFVLAYEDYAKRTKKPDKEFTDLYNQLLPKSYDARTNLQNMIDRRAGTYSERKEPWAKEETLKKVLDVLQNGIKVEDKGGDKPRKDLSKTPAKREIPQELKGVTVYRTVYEPDEPDDRTRAEILESWGGAEYWTNKKGVAETYADGQENPVILKGNIISEKPFIVDAKGHSWDDFQNMFAVKDGAEVSLKDEFPELFTRIANGEFSDPADIQTELNKTIKQLGHDVIETRNVIDTNNQDSYKKLSTTYSVLDDRVLKIESAFAMEEQDRYGVSTFESKAFKKNIPEYYKMPEVAQVVAETVKEQVKPDVPKAQDGAVENQGVISEISTKIDKIATDANLNAIKDAIISTITAAQDGKVSVNADALTSMLSKIQIYPDNSDVITAIQRLVEHLGSMVGQDDTLQAIKGILEAKNNVAEKKLSPEEKNETSTNKERRFERLNDVASFYEDVENVDAAIQEFSKLYKEIVLIGDEATKVIRPNKTGINTLRKIANGDIDPAYDYSWVEFKRNNPSVEADKMPANYHANAFGPEDLKNILSAITYNVNVVKDEDSVDNKVAIDEVSLEATLNKVFTNILNPQTQQNDSETQEHWALESTLQTVKGVLDGIQTNTSKISTGNVDTIAGTALDSRLTEIKSVLESIDKKIVDGGKIINRDGAKQAYKEAQDNPAPDKNVRSNMMKSLINDYQKMGKLAAQYASDENLETKAMLENLREEIKRKRESLKITMDENKNLREKYSLSFNAEKKLLDAEKAQEEIDKKKKQKEKDDKADWKKQVKEAQRATGINAATSAANAGDQTVLRAIGTEGVSNDIEDKAKELSDQIKALRKLRDEIDKKGDETSEEDRKKLSQQISSVKELKTELDSYLKIHEKYSGEGVDDLGDASNFGAVGTDQYWNNITDAIKKASDGKTAIKGLNAETGELTGTTKIAANTFAQWTATVDPLTGRLKMLRTGIKKTETLMESITRKTKEIFTYFSGSSIIFTAFNELKKGIQYVRDIDLALTELKKVTDETEEEYDQFLQTAAKTGARLGTTISAVTEATATFAKLGYTMEQSIEMAEAAIVYKNVGDNIASTGDAADSIISTMKGFGIEASESMAIVDKFNEVGNKFAITSQGIGEALRLSASALNEGGNSLDEAIGIITAANEVVNDPSSVGTALKTLTLRLRGSKTELEEMGEDVSDMATTTSQLQAKLLALTGGKVDIMLDENTFKNSTQILREMADAWEDMNDIQRASALELMGGKRQANVLSALIQNFDTVEKVIETSANSSGSALKENERYLDSIQGKIDQFTNATQTMWSHALNSDVVKFFVDLGTILMKVIDAIGLLNSAVLVFAGSKLVPWILSLTTGMNTFGDSLRYLGMMMTSVNGTGAALIPTIVAQTKALWAGSAGANVFTLSIKTLGVAFKALMATPLGWFLAIAAAIALTVHLFDVFTTTTEELKEELKDLQTELRDIKSDLESVNSELETTNDRMAELLAKDKLSFVEEEELKALKERNAELQREIDLLELKEKQTKKDTADKFVETMESDVNTSSGWGNEYKQDGGKIRKVKWYDWVFDYSQTYLPTYEASENDYIQQQVARYQELQNEIDAKEKEILETDGTDEKSKNKREKLEKKKKELEDKAIEIEDYINSKTTEWDELSAELDYGINDETDDWLDYINNIKDKWAIASGGNNAKTNAISRIFNKDQNTGISESIDDYVEALKKGDTSAKQSIENIIKNNENLVKDLEASGLSIDDAVDYFTSFASEANYDTIDGKLKEIEEVTKRLKTALSEDFDTSSIDTIKKSLTDKGWVDSDGNIMSDAIAEYFGGEDGGISDKTRTEIERLVKQIYDGKISVQDALKSFELFSVQSIIDIQIAAVKTNFKDVFVDLEDADGLIDTFEELGSAIGSTVGALEAFNQAQADVADKGFVSIQTALQLMEYTDDYGSVLQVVNGKLQLAENAEQNLIQARIDAIKVSAQTAVADAQAAYDKAQLAVQSYRSAMVEETSASTVATAWQKIVATAAGIKNALANIWSGESIGDLYNSGYNSYLESATGYETTYDDAGLQVLEDALADANKKLNEAKGNAEIANAMTADNLEDVFNPSDKSNPEEVIDDVFKKEMDYWENRISANQAKYEQLQNEIDLLEKKGQKADASFYEKQIDLENKRKWLLEQQKYAAKEHLATLEEGSEEWWEAANILNDIEGELDGVTSSIVDLQDAISEIDTYKFEEFNTRIDNLINKLDAIGDLIAPNGEEDWFDDEGNWTEAGIAVLGRDIQKLEFFKQEYQETMNELAKYEPDYNGNEAYYEGLGIHSEQEYYDKTEALISQQYDFAESISDTEQSIVDMYESSVDAVEEYVNTLIDGYNDYIDSVKEALDAERDLYDFKKNVQKQAKDIAEIERRIASLSGSTNKADVAERRKLEAQLYESRESLNDTYYDHAKDAQNDALDAEVTAYEETMTKMVEGMRESLQEATADMDTFLNNVTIAVSMNADTVLEKYRETNVYLDPALTNPWENAKTKVGEYGDKANNLMDVWKNDGYFAEFKSTASTNLSSPWSAGTDAANTFKSSVSTAMRDVVSNITTNVKTASSELSKLYQQILDTENRAANVNSNGSGAVSGATAGTSGTLPLVNTNAPKTVDDRILKKYKLTASQVIALGYGPINLEKFEQLLRDYQIKYSSKYKQVANTQTVERSLKKVLYGEYITGPLAIGQYAKGTTGTKRNEWAITDEPQFGDELVLVPGKNGNLSFMRKGTGVVPADLTANLMEWGQFTPDSMSLGGGVNVSMINNAVNKPEFNFTFDALVKAEHIDENTLPEVKRFVQQEINSLVKQMNYAIKGKGAR